MLIADILHSCSNERVADAALASIGGDFAERVRDRARRHNMTAGAFVGSLVRRFALDAHERDWRYVVIAIGGDDFPVLAGLRAILEAMMRNPGVLPEPPHQERSWTAKPERAVEALSA